MASLMADAKVDIDVKQFFDEMSETERIEMAALLDGAYADDEELLRRVFERCLGIGWKCDELIAKLQAAKLGVMPS